MGVTAIVPVQDSLIQWRTQHELLTFHPDQVLQLPDVLYKSTRAGALRFVLTRSS